jgi:hypothetical protein
MVNKGKYRLGVITPIERYLNNYITKKILMEPTP